MRGRFCALLSMVMLAVFASAAGVEAGEGNRHPGVDWAGVLAHNGQPPAFVDQGEQAGSCWYVTESGYVAAVEEELLDRAIFWAGMGDEGEFERFIESNPLVFPLRAGLRVQIDKFSFSDKVRIRPDGVDISVWTVREAIRSLLPVDGS